MEVRLQELAYGDFDCMTLITTLSRPYAQTTVRFRCMSTESHFLSDQPFLSTDSRFNTFPQPNLNAS